MAQSSDATLAVTTPQRTYVGKLLAWDSQQLAMLRTNGRLSYIPRDQIQSMKQVSGQFAPLTRTQLQQDLQKEFGPRYEVSVTQRFIVVHPRGAASANITAFDRLFEQFRQFFWSRGFSLDRPEFPMVAVILTSRQEFDGFLRAYVREDDRIQGYYSPDSNRIITYQPDTFASGNTSVLQLSTVIHEVTHQVAYNTGVHSRTSETPRWVSEGLATLFEARGIHASYQYSGLSERINRRQLQMLLDCARANRLRGKLERLIADDQLFEEDPLLAYALAWGLHFYACETRPADYSRYLRQVAGRPDFVAYSTADRIADFQQHLGRDLNDLELRMLNYLADLR